MSRISYLNGSIKKCWKSDKNDKHPFIWTKLRTNTLPSKTVIQSRASLIHHTLSSVVTFRFSQIHSQHLQNTIGLSAVINDDENESFYHRHLVPVIISV